MVLLPQSKQLGSSAVHPHMMRALGWGRANVSLLSRMSWSEVLSLTVADCGAQGSSSPSANLNLLTHKVGIK